LFFDGSFDKISTAAQKQLRGYQRYRIFFKKTV